MYHSLLFSLFLLNLFLPVNNNVCAECVVDSGYIELIDHRAVSYTHLKVTHGMLLCLIGPDRQLFSPVVQQ